MSVGLRNVRQILYGKVQIVLYSGFVSAAMKVGGDFCDEVMSPCNIALESCVQRSGLTIYGISNVFMYCGVLNEFIGILCG